MVCSSSLGSACLACSTSWSSGELGGKLRPNIEAMASIKLLYWSLPVNAWDTHANSDSVRSSVSFGSRMTDSSDLGAGSE